MNNYSKNKNKNGKTEHAAVDCIKTCQRALTTFKESAIQNATKFSHPHWRRSGSTVGRIQNASVSVMSSYRSEV
jgi:hypothetical protein